MEALESAVEAFVSRKGTEGVIVMNRQGEIIRTAGLAAGGDGPTTANQDSADSSSASSASASASSSSASSASASASAAFASDAPGVVHNQRGESARSAAALVKAASECARIILSTDGNNQNDEGGLSFIKIRAAQKELLIHVENDFIFVLIHNPSLAHQG